MKCTNVIKRSALSLAISAVLAAPAVQAAEASKNDGDKALEVIMVTAQKRLQSMQDVPVSITAVDGDELDAMTQGGADIRFLAARIPSVNVESSMGRTYPRFYIRGLGNTDYDMNASQPVSLIYDDVVMENPMLKGFPVFDTERIEVLRGPQGTLFGRNTPAGIVKFDSVKPSYDTNGYLSAGYGTYNTQEYEGAVGGGLSDTVSARVSGLYQHRDDWVDNTATPGSDDLEGFDDRAWRAQVLWEPSEDFSALLNMHGRNMDGTARVFRANIIKEGSNDLVDGFDEDKVTQDGNNDQSIDQFGSSLTLKGKVGDYDITSITAYETVEAYSVGDIDGGYGASYLGNDDPAPIPYASETADEINGHDQWTEELRLSTDLTDQLFFQTGVFYFYDKVDVTSYNYDTFSDHVTTGLVDTSQKNTSWAIFGQLEYRMTDDLTVSGGLRYTWDEKDFTAARLLDPAGGSAYYPDKVSTDDSFLSWDVAAHYSVTDDFGVYARLAQASRAPSIQGRIMWSDEVSVADTETLTSIETGFKSDLLDRSMRINADVYYYQIDDQQLTATGGDSNVTRLINADKTIGYGVEADIEYRPIDNLMLNAGVSYNYTEIQDSDLRVAVCGSGCTVTDKVVDGYAYIDGNALPQAPKWILNAGARYGVPIDSGELYFGTDWAYRSKINFFLYESEEYTGKPLLEGGVKAGWTSKDGKYDVSVYGRNILNEIQVVSALDFNNRTGMVNEPRIFGVEAKVNF